MFLNNFLIKTRYKSFQKDLYLTLQIPRFTKIDIIFVNRTYTKERCESYPLFHSLNNQMFKHSLKGGDPTAGSPTVTLLRLHPSR